MIGSVDIMQFQKGNQFWKMRSKHGRDRIFQTPEILLEACYEYFEYTDSRKWSKTDWVGKDAIQVERETSVPYTITGMCIFLGVNSVYWAQFKKAAPSEFSKVITHVEEIIYSQKFEGASVGAFNANIIARDLGLADKQISEHHVQAIETLRKFFPSFEDSGNDDEPQTD